MLHVGQPPAPEPSYLELLALPQRVAALGAELERERAARLRLEQRVEQAATGAIAAGAPRPWRPGCHRVDSRFGREHSSDRGSGRTALPGGIRSSQPG